MEGTKVMVDFTSDIVSDNGGSLLVKEGRSDTVFHYSRGLPLQPAYRLDMGALAISDDLLDGSSGPDMGEEKYAITDINEGDRYIFVTTWELGKWDPVHLLFDREDLSAGFHATGGAEDKPGLFIDKIGFTPVYVRDNHLVGYMQSFDIIDNADSITHPALKALAADIREDSNPVIVIAKLKK